MAAAPGASPSPITRHQARTASSQHAVVATAAAQPCAVTSYHVPRSCVWYACTSPSAPHATAATTAAAAVRSAKDARERHRTLVTCLLTGCFGTCPTRLQIYLECTLSRETRASQCKWLASVSRAIASLPSVVCLLTVARDHHEGVRWPDRKTCP